MKVYFSCILIAAVQFILQGQTLPPDRFYDWSKAGLSGMLPDSAAVSINIKDAGAANDGSVAADGIIQDAISSLNGRFGILYFPAGIYLVTTSLVLPDSVVLKGASADSTTLLFDLGGAPNDAIDVSENQSEILNPFTKIISGIEKEATALTVADASGFAGNDYAEIRQENGSWDTQPASYAEKSVGQMVKIISVSGNVLHIAPALRIDFDTLLHAEIRKINPATHVGIECLKIIRQDSSATPSVYNINFNFAVNCRVRGVESAKSMGAHILVEYSKNIEISGCFIHHSFGYDGTGTRGYGVCLRQHASDCLIENNAFAFLRHAMMVKEGANGNVFAYNYSRDPVRSEPVPDFSADVSLHGHYAFANLFEGNIVQNIIIDHVWGQSGPHNTFLRNRAELYGMGFTGNAPISANQNFVGNEISNTSGGLYGNYLMAGTGQFEFGNNVKGTITPTGTSLLNDSTYYLAAKPAFWDSTNWVTIGIPNGIGSGTIPAKKRLLDSLSVAVCRVFDSLPGDTIPDSTTAIGSALAAENILLYPNPAAEKVFLQFNSIQGSVNILLTDVAGKLLLCKQFMLHEEKNLVMFDLSEITPGCYFIKTQGAHTATKKLFIQ